MAATVYLLHAERPYLAGRRPRHYLGQASELAEHEAGTGARLTAVWAGAGIRWECVRTWAWERGLERRLKSWKNAARLCPRCRPAADGSGTRSARRSGTAGRRAGAPHRFSPTPHAFDREGRACRTRRGGAERSSRGSGLRRRSAPRPTLSGGGGGKEMKGRRNGGRRVERTASRRACEPWERGANRRPERRSPLRQWCRAQRRTPGRPRRWGPRLRGEPRRHPLFPSGFRGQTRSRGRREWSGAPAERNGGRAGRGGVSSFSARMRAQRCPERRGWGWGPAPAGGTAAASCFTLWASEDTGSGDRAERNGACGVERSPAAAGRAAELRSVLECQSAGTC